MAFCVASSTACARGGAEIAGTCVADLGDVKLKVRGVGALPAAQRAPSHPLQWWRTRSATDACRVATCSLPLPSSSASWAGMLQAQHTQARVAHRLARGRALALLLQLDHRLGLLVAAHVRLEAVLLQHLLARKPQRRVLRIDVVRAVLHAAQADASSAQFEKSSMTCDQRNHAWRRECSNSPGITGGRTGHARSAQRRCPRQNPPR